MSHPEQMRFIADTKVRFPKFFRGQKVLEVGSRDINGSVRIFFEGCKYIGIDCTPGGGVDVVSLAHEYVSPTGPFDVVITTEALEHDPYWEQSLLNCIGRLLRPGGLFLATWASPVRQEHGTTRSTGVEEIFGPNPEYYAGVSPDDFRIVVEPLLRDLEVALIRSDLDVQALGFRRDV